MRGFRIHFLPAVFIVLTAVMQAPAATGADGRAEIVAAGRDGQTLMEFVGRVDQNGLNFTFIGYLTRVNGLDEAALFAGGNAAARDEKTAHFTLIAETTLTSRSVVDKLFAVDSSGTLEIFFNETPSSNFSDPGSFSTGEMIATFDTSVQNTINVIAPNQGMATTWGVLKQTKAGVFRLGGTRFQFGHKNQRERISASGQGKLLDATAPISVVFISGNTVGLE